MRMTEKHKEPHKKIAAYLPVEDYIKLRAKLILEGKTFSSWLTEKIKEELK